MGNSLSSLFAEIKKRNPEWSLILAEFAERAEAAEAERDRLQEALRERDGIISGLNDMIAGRTKPLDQIRAELEGKKVPSA